MLNLILEEFQATELLLLASFPYHSKCLFKNRSLCDRRRCLPITGFKNDMICFDTISIGSFLPCLNFRNFCSMMIWLDRPGGYFSYLGIFFRAQGIRLGVMLHTPDSVLVVIFIFLLNPVWKKKIKIVSSSSI